ncbi:MAG: DinB family protein [Terriglobales bacterium]
MGDTTLRELVYGKGAHVDPIACVEDIGAGLAARTVTGYPHSIWQIVEHMNYWMTYEVHRIAGKGPSYPDHAIESWPAHPEPAREDQWQSARQRFGDLLARLASLTESDAATFRKSVPPDNPSSPPSTVGAVLKQITAHNSYHVGQIAMLRRQFDAWPPRRGGDSW